MDAAARNPVEELVEQFLDQLRSGDPVTIQDYENAYPELAEEIRLQFPTVMAMEQLKAKRLSSADRCVTLEVDVIDQIGDYRVVKEIARGGMGVVYEAEQTSLLRPVALKVFPRRVFRESRQLDRFRKEAQTAGRLHHTNIVPIFSVGEEDGLHFYVMQRIYGRSLDQIINESPQTDGSATRQPSLDDKTDDVEILVADSRQSEASDCDRGVASLIGKQICPETDLQKISPDLALNSREIAKVGLQVSSALSYAHDKNVLHRDIKPGNLLLDAQGTVLVTDFGLATILEVGRNGDTDDIVGTPRYMAPEQFAGTQDARSDIYSLGVTLYELLTLRPAFRYDSRREAIRHILQGTVTPPRVHSPRIPRDLEAIVLKAMSLDPDDRYQIADELTVDLRRFLDGRPVAARRLSAPNRFWRWLRRSPVVGGLTTALVVVIVASLVVISTKWRESVTESTRAEVNLALALDLMDQMLQRFDSSWMSLPVTMEGGVPFPSDLAYPMEVSGHSVKVQNDALKFYEQFARQNPTSPQLKRETARVHCRVADIYKRLGQYNKAIGAYQVCLELLAELADGTDALNLDRAQTFNQLGKALHATSRFVDAEQRFRNALQILSGSKAKEDTAFRVEVANASANLGQALWMLGRSSEAQQSHQRAINVLQKVVEELPGNTEFRLALAQAYRNMATFASFSRRRHDQSFSASRTAGISLLEDLIREFPNVPDYQCELSEVLSTRRFRQLSLDHSNGLADLERSVDLARNLSARFPSIPRYRMALARALKVRSDVSAFTDEQAATEFANQSMAIYRSLSSESPSIPAYHIVLAMALQDRARVLSRTGHDDRAVATLQEGIEEQKLYNSLRPDNPLGRSNLDRMQRDLKRLEREGR